MIFHVFLRTNLQAAACGFFQPQYSMQSCIDFLLLKLSLSNFKLNTLYVRFTAVHCFAVQCFFATCTHLCNECFYLSRPLKRLNFKKPHLKDLLESNLSLSGKSNFWTPTMQFTVLLPFLSFSDNAIHI